jgi:hypothetical protein
MSNLKPSNIIDQNNLIPEIQNVQDLIPIFRDQYCHLWWSTSMQKPQFELIYTNAQHKDNEKLLDRESNDLINAAKHIQYNQNDLAMFQKNTRPAIARLSDELFHIKPEAFEFIERTGIQESGLTFFRMARDFDPGIPFADIYQAGRNIITANLIQLLLGIPVHVSSSLFAYSMLYPYTDNYLDDPVIPLSEKKSFNQRFRNRLLGEMVEPVNKHEEIINSLIQMIESEWDRDEYPQVYQSLMTIHSAQARSLDLVSPELSPYEKDILGITFEKGGTSVLTDGYLAAGSLSYSQACALFGFGAFTQMMDDMEDIGTDIRENRASLFSISAPYWKLDTLCNRFFNFGRNTITDLNMFNGRYVAEVTGLISRCLDPMLLVSISQSLEYFSRPYIQELETHLPFKFLAVERQRRKLSKNQARLLQLMEASMKI